MASTDGSKKIVRKERWYFGGLSSAGAACFTHPLDTIKVVLQTSREKESVIAMTKKVIRRTGFLGLYKGIDASLFRQITYSGSRFGVYSKIMEEVKNRKIKPDKKINVIAASLAGIIGGFVGTPADIMNVRMQNDSKLPPEKRRNYKHVVDGLIRTSREEGITSLFKGASFVMVRSIAMTVGQLVIYDSVKEFLLSTPYFDNNLTTHFTSSSLAGLGSTFMTQPIDVMKTRIMNAKPGQYKNLFDVFFQTLKTGPLTFFKGMLPSGVRLIPHTIILFLIFEQLTKRFGYIEEVK